MNTSCVHYDNCRLPAAKCNTRCDFAKTPEGWSVVFNPKPIPSRNFDYDFTHENFDGENGLCGTAASIKDAAQQIFEIEAEINEIH